MVAAVVFGGLLTVVGTYYISRIPLPDALALPATTTVYYADGRTVMARLGVQNRIIVDPDRLPYHVAAAVVAAEDPQFWDDSATLISRQYARAATDVDVTSATGKARLLVMSWRLEDQYQKDEILGFYLNTVYFGRGAYGIEASSKRS
jgi:membrane peptidoglycan carboxypeptidase